MPLTAMYIHACAFRERGGRGGAGEGGGGGRNERREKLLFNDINKLLNSDVIAEKVAHNINQLTRHLLFQQRTELFTATYHTCIWRDVGEKRGDQSTHTHTHTEGTYSELC